MSVLSNLNKFCVKQICNQNHKFNSAFVQHYTTKLAEVGRFEEPISDKTCYPSGQPFLHKIFGYRGVLLFSWQATVNDIDLRKQFNESNKKYTTPESPSEIDQDLDEHKFDDTDESVKTPPPSSSRDEPDSQQLPFTRTHPYYQALIDSRDCLYVSNRTQVEAVTFLGHPDNSRSVYSIKGLDYVAHDDVMPFTSHEKLPIQHELYNKLFNCNNNSNDTANKYVPSKSLEYWKNKHPWLNLSKVYRETTKNIRVSVIPFYLGHTEVNETSYHWWRYCVRLENLGETSVQLRERHWKIFSQRNMLQTVKGRGVVGIEPLLSKNEPAYQYSSHVNLQDTSGHMWGSFKMECEEGQTFECRVPPFSLESSLET